MEHRTFEICDWLPYGEKAIDCRVFSCMSENGCVIWSRWETRPGQYTDDQWDALVEDTKRQVALYNSSQK